MITSAEDADLPASEGWISDVLGVEAVVAVFCATAGK
jgi:hypothetical protein